MIDVIVIVGALALVGLAAFLVVGCGSSSGGRATGTQSVGGTQQQQAEAAARHFLNRYVDGDGRVVRRDK